MYVIDIFENLDPQYINGLCFLTMQYDVFDKCNIKINVEQFSM